MPARPVLDPAPSNERVMAFLNQVGPHPPGRDRDPYLEASHHPDIVERVWDGLGANLPEPCRFLALGNPVLAHPRVGAVLALPRGTTYALWLATDDRAASDLSPIHRWGNGSQTDLAEQLGEGWYRGRFEAREPTWCAAAYDWWEARPDSIATTR